uniref:Bacterial surface antigen (D15) domain-containing protein n=1 Tax=uncultured bacterium lac160 TaxID=1447241 RepID=X2LJQ3_9BACT|nr:hypothetical protein [uncultured bacterium lac160]
MARRRAADSAVSNYRARIHYRLAVGLGRRRWARVPTSAVEEQVADVQWQRPNDLRVDVIGRRARSRSEIRLSSVWDRPWFVPRSVDDSVRIFSDEFPATGALHPLASEAPAWYRYGLAGDLSVTPGQGGTLRLLQVEVTPRRTGLALVAGEMWIDSASAEVVRFAFRYVGTGLWVRPEGSERSDSSSARLINRIANQIVSIDADLEYGLQDGRFWMPYRQVVSGRVRIPLVSDVVIPFRAVTTFDDFEINTGRPITFELPLSRDRPDSVEARRAARRDSLRAERRRDGDTDSLRAWDYADRWAGGRYELHRPSNDSLGRFREWTDSLTLEAAPADMARARGVEAELARLAERLPDSVTGQRAHGIGYERLTDAMRYDRVQGLSLGLGYRVRVPGLAFTGLYASARYGFSDERVTGRVSLVRDAPEGRLTVSGTRDVVNVDPFAPSPGFGNTLNALFVSHDDGDYALVHGGSAMYEMSLATGLELAVGARYERQSSVARAAQSEVNDFLGGAGLFPPNPPVNEGRFGGGFVRMVGVEGVQWRATADVLGGGGTTTGRVYGEVRHGIGGRRGATFRLKTGIATRPTLRQSAFRLGGIGTVRGHEYGERRGQAFWATQVDVAPLSGRLRPVVFLDAGQAGGAGSLFSGRVLVGAGAGVSLFGGLVRFDVSRSLAPDRPRLRFDIAVQGPR